MVGGRLAARQGSWIHLEDEVGACFLIARPDARGAFNLTAPQPVTNRQFARTLGKVMHRPSIVPAPALAMRLALGEMADVLLTGQRAVPEHLAEMGFAFKFVELEDALRDVLGG
jgi:NAD dependent epimerase/dehydratase family enzyme